MNRNNRTVLQLVGIVLVMGALSWAAVPFYSWFCRVTGFGGTTMVAEAASDVVLDETIRVRFDANVDRNMGWSFRPLQREIELKIGENGLAFYEAINTSDVPITGTASYNVAPEVAGYYFAKIECFCFTEQTLQPGERIEMPVSFFVDPELVNDRDAGRVRNITLSYTFHRTDKTADARSATAGGTTLD
ncbi:cytochrome c oxidase assembly protein [uncultured Paracoccus sp.]|uniref:cytochrome c oxidase assembly protein n=1 Tax=uncultured Paracoccus sp. TaxID=189685 RepID=UPI0025F349FF|nr:cytochrome c oxidase assembly protein [uncultured Paracoccus sp.]